MSGRLSASECRSYLGYAVSGFLHKPFEISMVTTMLCKLTNEGTGRAAPKLAILGRSQDEGNARTNAGKNAALTRRRPTGASFPRVLNPGPFPSGRGSKRDTPTAVKSNRRAALLAWQERGAAVARPSQPPKEPGKKLSVEGKNFSCLRCVCSRAKRQNFHQNRTAKKLRSIRRLGFSGRQNLLHQRPHISPFQAQESLDDAGQDCEKNEMSVERGGL